jgi:hypothetical protein
MHTHVRERVCVCVCVCVSVCARARAYVCVWHPRGERSAALPNAHVCMYVYDMRTYMHAYIHTYAYPRIVHINMDICIHTHTAYTHTHLYIHTRTCVLTHTAYTHICTYTHTHTYDNREDARQYAFARTHNTHSRQQDTQARATTRQVTMCIRATFLCYICILSLCVCMTRQIPLCIYASFLRYTCVCKNMIIAYTPVTIHACIHKPTYIYTH